MGFLRLLAFWMMAQEVTRVKGGVLLWRFFLADRPTRGQLERLLCIGAVNFNLDYNRFWSL